jgi:hypothetical protein
MDTEIGYGTVVEITRGKLKGVKGTVYEVFTEPHDDYCVIYYAEASKMLCAALLKRGSLRPVGTAKTAWTVRLDHKVADPDAPYGSRWVQDEDAIVLTDFCDRVGYNPPRPLYDLVKGWIEQYGLGGVMSPGNSNLSPKSVGSGYAGFHWHTAAGTDYAIHAVRQESPVY